jgi:hypothetical protein
MGIRCSTKSVPLLIKSADDQGGTFTGLTSGVDNLDDEGDIVRRGAVNKSLASGTRRYRWSPCTRQMTHAAMSVMSSRPPRPTTVWIKGRFDLGTEFGKSDYRNTKGRSVSGRSIGCAIPQLHQTAAGHEQTDLSLIEVPLVARGADPAASISSIKSATPRLCIGLSSATVIRWRSGALGAGHRVDCKSSIDVD